MAKSIGKFAVNIGANTTGFSKGMGRASKLSGGFSKGLGAMAVKLAGVAAAMVAVGSALRSVAAQFGEIDKIAKFSTATGVATSSLVALGHAGRLAGVESDTVNKGIARMTRNLGEAKAGLKASARGFEMLGLNAADLSKMSPEEQFAAIADKIRAIKDPAERAAAAYAIFGRAGQEMLPMLMQGAEGIEKARKEAEELGISFNAVDAARIEEANDAWTRVKTGITGLVRIFTIHLAPVLTAISNRFVEFAKGIVAKVREWKPVFEQFKDTAIAVFQAFWGYVKATFNSLASLIGGSMGDIKATILEALIRGEFAFANIGTIAKLAFIKAKLGVMAFAGTIKHLFTGILPVLFEWFGKEWSNIWRTAVDFGLTVLINYGKNVRSFFKSIWAFIKTGEWEFAFTPLTEGFVNTVGELPEIPARAIGPLEKQLREDAEDIENDLSRDFDAFRQKKLDEFDKMPVPDAVAKITAPSMPKVADAKGTGPAGPVAALERGSAAAFSAIAKQIRGASQEKRDEANLNANERTADAVEGFAEAALGLAQTKRITI